MNEFLLDHECDDDMFNSEGEILFNSQFNSKYMILISRNLNVELI